MFFLLSGEGPTDLGICTDGSLTCEGQSFRPGPMSIIVDQVVERKHRYSILEVGAVYFVAERGLAERPRI